MVDEQPLASGEGGVGVVGEFAEAGGEGVGEEPVVGVEEDQVVPGGVAQAGVAGGGQAAVGLADADHAGVAGGDGAGVVGGAVVDDDDLDPGVGLGQDAVEGVGKEVGLVVAGDDDRDQGGGRVGGRWSAPA